MAVGNLSGVALVAHGSCTDANGTAKLDANAVDAPAVRDVLEKMAGAVRKTMTIADAVVSFDPTHPDSPWAGVKAVLLVSHYV